MKPQFSALKCICVWHRGTYNKPRELLFYSSVLWVGIDMPIYACWTYRSTTKVEFAFVGCPLKLWIATAQSLQHNTNTPRPIHSMTDDYLVSCPHLSHSANSHWYIGHWSSWTGVRGSQVGKAEKYKHQQVQWREEAWGKFNREQLASLGTGKGPCAKTLCQPELLCIMMWVSLIPWRKGKKV